MTISPDTASSDYPTLPADEIEWSFTTPERVVAIGDIHGDLEALCHVLLDRQLINPSGRWVGGRAHLVLVGDLVGGGRYSRLLLNFLIRLEREAALEGGWIHALLGNHDLLPVQQNFRKMTAAEKSLYKKFPIHGAEGQKIKHVFSGNSTYAKWIRERNSIIRIGDSLFVHAGVDEWALHADPGAVNATVRAWIRFWQGVAERPGKKTAWAASSEDGPLWTRAFKVRLSKKGKRPRKGMSRKAMDEILDHLGVKRIVIGHSPVKKGKILSAHPYYDERIVMIDTRISDLERGKPSCLEIRGNDLASHYADRTPHSKAIVESELSFLETATSSELNEVERLTKALFDAMGSLKESIWNLFR